jgi:predicted KAP-like P-loop ATPase
MAEEENEQVWHLDAPDASQDRPIEQSGDDLLDRGPFVESLARALVKDVRDEKGTLVARRSTGFIVGLTGSWGLGKSSILNLLALHLGSQEKVIVTKFNPWLFKGRDELLTAFFNSLRQAMGSSNTEAARQLADALDRYRRALEMTAHAVAAGVDVAGAGGAASAATRATFKWWKKREPPSLAENPIKSIYDERERLENKLKELDSAVVILIDELDRVEDDEVRAVAQLVKAVGDIRGISYLVAYDPKRVAEALGRGTDDVSVAAGNSYLEKIIQHPIPMRPLFSEDVDKLLHSALDAHGVEMSEGDEEEDIEIVRLVKLGLTTPREVKRLIGSFAVIERAVRGEVNPTHVLAYCWILTKAPELRARIAADLDKFVDDPSEGEMLRRAYREVPAGEPEEITNDFLLGAGAKEYEPI